MNLRLRTQYTIAITAITVLTTCALAVVLLYGTNRAVTSLATASSEAASDRLLDQMYLRGMSVTHIVGENILNAVYSYDMEGMENVLSDARSQPDIVRAFVYGPDGAIIHDGTSDIESMGELVSGRALAALDPDLDGSAVTRLSDGILTVASPLRLGDETIGGLAIEFSLAGIHANMASMRSDLDALGQAEADRAVLALALAAALTMAAGILVAARVARKLSDPITRLSAATVSVGKHDWDARIEAGGSRELVELISSFNNMTADLRRTTVSIDRLEEIVDRRTAQLRSVNERQRREVSRRRDVEAELRRYQDGLEEIVADRTAALSEANARLRVEMEERLSAEEKRRHVEEQLLRSRKMEALGMLAGGVAHDLNNILSGIVTYPELLLYELPPDSNLVEPLNTIKQSGERAAAVVQDLLTMARRGVASTEPLDLNAVVEQYLATPEHAKVMSEHPSVTVETRLDPDIPPVMGSRIHISKALMNLVMNACEATSDEGSVIISTRTAGGTSPDPVPAGVDAETCAVLEVADTGEGIAPDDLERIFEPFYTKKKLGRSGSGLGMAIVWGTVTDHGGHIDTVSEPGVGTTFTIYFPATSNVAETRQPDRGIEDFSGNGEKILVVDDIPEQRAIAMGMLRSMGYNANAVASGEEAIEYIRDNDCGLLVLDMVMDPGMDGLDTYRRALEVRPGLPAVIASGFSESDRVLEAEKLGAAAYIQKPYRASDLGEAVRSALGAH